MAAGAAAGPDPAAAIELRITLARKAGGETMRREFAVIREQARAVLGSGSWPYLGMPLASSTSPGDTGWTPTLHSPVSRSRYHDEQRPPWTSPNN
jgi:hypothetical protein